jgi:outer membrane protein assembly factor BamB
MPLILQIMLGYAVVIIASLLLMWWSSRLIEHPIRRRALTIVELITLVALLVVITKSGQQVNVPAPLPPSVHLVINNGYDLKGLQASDGSQRWSSYGDGLLGPSSVGLTDSSMIYRIGHDRSNSLLSSLVALRATDGQLAWHTDFPLAQAGRDCSGAFSPSYFKLLAAEGYVYVYDCQGDTLYAFQSSDGKQIWHLSGEHLDSSNASPPCSLPSLLCSSLLSFASGAGFIFTLSRNGDISALQAANGTLAWHSNIKIGVGENSLTLAGNTLYVEAGNMGVFALRAQDGKVLWQFAQDVLAPHDLSATNSRVYVYLEATNHVYALDSRTGTTLWQQSVPPPLGIANLFATDNALYLIAGYTLSTFSATDGSLLWQYQQNNGFLFWQAPDDERGVLGTPSVIDGVIFLPITGYVPAFESCLWSCAHFLSGIIVLNAVNGSFYWKQFQGQFEPEWQWVGVTHQ